jgi:hypothetical protein
MALHAAAEPAKRHQFLVGDGACSLVEGVEQRRGMALGEDQVIVGRVVRSGEVILEVFRHQHGHQVGGGQRRGGVAGTGSGGGPDAVDA